eukprot:gene29976-18047_t
MLATWAKSLISQSRWASESTASALRSFAAAANSGPQKKLGIAKVEHIVAVASAKGGVGKSTTAVNLAAALATSLKLRVGLLDADVHGPSLGKMMNLKGEPAIQGPLALMCPKENHGLKVMSMAFFMEEDTPALWRGPMVNKAFDKMLLGTDWGELDVLVVDMPPGTGDAQINLCQRIPLSGAIIVSTPQDIALLDARRGALMFQKMHVPLLGLVENMSYHKCTNCGHQEHIFGHGGVHKMAEDFGTKVLAEVPLDIENRMNADKGAPTVICSPGSTCAVAYLGLASQVKAKLAELEGDGPIISQ